MIVPSIDITNGRAVQLRGGKQPPLDAGNPLELAERYGRVGEFAVVDLDAAKGVGSNRELILSLCRIYRARVGGGIRTIDLAMDYLNGGARSIIIGTSATPEFLSSLPRERVIAALDSKEGNIMVEGWSKQREGSIEESIIALAPYVSGFLITFIETEGDQCGIDIERARKLIALAPDSKFTFAGGAAGGERGIADIATLDRLGADLQAGTSLVLGDLSLAEAFAAPLITDRADGLWPTVVCDESGKALGLVHSSKESLKLALNCGKGVYHSRSRGLWVKGESSGNDQILLRAELDCDRDTIRFTVRQNGEGFCHLGRRTCFDNGYGLEKLDRTIKRRLKEAPQGSYTRRLFADEALLASKLREEVQELIQSKSLQETISEAADVLYFALVKTISMGGGLSDIEEELERRSLRVTRRGGNAKPEFEGLEGKSEWKSIH
ncbi:MAG TPA: phosphoribosyl-ATP diphosphatase [Rectinema sp.]|jgi:phosphoribosyl-ATP pyrophosphohydrolase|nr:phosphoribosyl-ATP diphosphatase [Spirochaetia bacterium]MDI9426534.1 phosphoribosyl-ATP diphosphatase [Spirochaetota bacterium]NLH89901.1 phosphoribosyl-ATP diphosphatase [Treponema sp.]OQC74455.1 MAG: 1-(5-phosphoribosyl)-5-((5-phosphoribosylamino)methylideneamino) imidazole-4-carboxamide isomerase [Spirochaetes bacterium ADurb.Bin001]HNP92785.1 phosphoribosyl-ATP diphosphatase [Rectinema sp.]